MIEIRKFRGGRIHGIAQKEYRNTAPPLRMRSVKKLVRRKNKRLRIRQQDAPIVTLPCQAPRTEAPCLHSASVALPFLLGCPNLIVSEPICLFEPLSKALPIYPEVSSGGVRVRAIILIPTKHPELVLHGVRRLSLFYDIKFIAHALT